MTKHELRIELHKIFPEWEPISLPFQKVERLFEKYYSVKDLSSNSIEPPFSDNAGGIGDVIFYRFITL